MDLGSIDQIIRQEDLTPVVAFHAQQCVEKCFKAVLEEHSQKVPKEHSTLKLYALVRNLAAMDADIEVLTDSGLISTSSRGIRASSACSPTASRRSRMRSSFATVPRASTNRRDDCWAQPNSP